MADEGGSDPFLWDVDRVIKELCTAEQTFVIPTAKKLPDPDILKAALLDCDVDGESLLTNDDLDKSHDLASILGIKKVSQRNALQQAVRFLKSKSFEYRQWKQTQLAQDELIPGSAIDTPRPSEDLWSRVSSRDSSLLPPTVRDTTETPVKTETSLDAIIPMDVDQIPTKPTLRDPNDEGGLGPEINSIYGSPKFATGAGGSESEEPPKKKKRIAPVNLSTIREEPPFLFPTEADALLAHPVKFASPSNVSKAYSDGPNMSLGSSKLDHGALLQLTKEQSGIPTKNFSQLNPSHAPSGRRRAVHRVIRRYLRTRKATFGTVDIVDPDSRDDVLPLFGESDEEYDSETWEEMEQEEKERQELALLPRRFLTLDEINLVIEQSLTRITEDWTRRKLPKLQSTSYRIWNAAIRQNTRYLKVKEAKAFRSQVDQRIEEICRKIRALQWTKQQEVQEQMASVELSVMQREEQTWIIELLSNPVQPPQPPQPAPKSRASREPRKRPVREVSDEEDLSSGSDGDSGGFVVEDDDEDENVSRGTRMASQEQSTEMMAFKPPNPTSAPRTPSSVKGLRRAGLLGSTTRQPILVPSSPLGDSPSSKTVTSGNTITLLQDTLEQWGSARRNAIMQLLHSTNADAVWRSVCNLQFDRTRKLGNEPLFGLFRLFHVYTRFKQTRIHQSSIDQATLERLKKDKISFEQMCSALRRHDSPRRRPASVSFVLKTSPKATELSASSARLLSRRLLGTRSDDDQSGSEEEEGSPLKHRRPLIRDRAAEDFREEVKRERAEQEIRKLMLRRRLAQLEPVAGNSHEIIINESKQNDDALIYVTRDIASRIKKHQVEGVRFMWDQVVAGDARTRKGCLLAHTMGLGKTMQVITLLVAIAEASQSPDPTAVSQIPPHLRKGRNLILCPSGLVDNWTDELLMWAPDGVLGELTKIHAKTDKEQAVRNWASSRGVLVVGYPIFTRMMQTHPDIGAMVHREADLVIADEAHKLKTPTSQVHAATANFETESRIALTGSPLANKVDDYYAMINWVSPNFLGPPEEFRQRYSNPIKTGLFADSHPQDKRLALRKLSILKHVAAPKMHRRGILSIKDELPLKKEFILYVPLTDLQLRAYQSYVQACQGLPGVNALNSQAKVWSFIGYLGSLLAHPQIFKAHLEGLKDNIQAAHARARKPDLAADKANEEEAVLPQGLISDALAVVNSVRDIADSALSWKVLLLSAILDEAHRLGERTLVFSQSLRTLDFLEELFRQQKRSWARLDGQTEAVHRQAAVKTFNSDKGADIYLISTRAGGVGLNLQGANRVVIFDFKYSPSDEQQAVGRAYRLGQLKPVFVYWLIVDGTFETVVQQRSVFKMQLSSRVVDKKNPIAWSKRMGNYFAAPRLPDQQDLSKYRGQDPLLDSLFQDETLAGGISRIDPIETFEQEEPDELMTAEDKKEVEQEIHDFINRGNPGQVAILPGAFSVPATATPTSEDVQAPNGLPVDQLPNVGLTPVVKSSVAGVADPDPMLPTSTDCTNTLSAHIPVRAHSAESVPVSSEWKDGFLQQGRSVPHSVNATPMSHPSLSLQFQGTGQAATASSQAWPGPLQLSQTYASPVSGSRHVEEPTKTPSTGHCTPRRSDNKLSELEQTMDKTYDNVRILNPGAQLPTPAQFVDALETCLLEDQVSGIALTDKVQGLLRAVTASANFVIAVLKGKVSAQTLARMSKQEIDRMGYAWNEIPVPELLREAAPDDDVAHMDVSIDREIATPRPRGRDEAEVAALLRRRAGRLFKRPVKTSRLPTWAPEALLRADRLSQQDGGPRPGDSAEEPIVFD